MTQPEISIARRRIEERYGEVGSGSKILFLGGLPVTLPKLSRKLMLGYDDLFPIDGGTFPSGVHWIRYFDWDQRKVLVFEFTSGFEIVAEQGADLMDWLHDDYFKVRWRVYCPAGAEEWLGFDTSKGGKR